MSSLDNPQAKPNTLPPSGPEPRLQPGQSPEAQKSRRLDVALLQNESPEQLCKRAIEELQIEKEEQEAILQILKDPALDPQKKDAYRTQLCERIIHEHNRRNEANRHVQMMLKGATAMQRPGPVVQGTLQMPHDLLPTGAADRLHEQYRQTLEMEATSIRQENKLYTIKPILPPDSILRRKLSAETYNLDEAIETLEQELLIAPPKDRENVSTEEGRLFRKGNAATPNFKFIHQKEQEIQRARRFISSHTNISQMTSEEEAFLQYYRSKIDRLDRYVVHLKKVDPIGVEWREKRREMKKRNQLDRKIGKSLVAGGVGFYAALVTIPTVLTMIRGKDKPTKEAVTLSLMSSGLFAASIGAMPKSWTEGEKKVAVDKAIQTNVLVLYYGLDAIRAMKGNAAKGAVQEYYDDLVAGGIKEKRAKNKELIALLGNDTSEVTDEFLLQFCTNEERSNPKEQSKLYQALFKVKNLNHRKEFLRMLIDVKMKNEEDCERLKYAVDLAARQSGRNGVLRNV